MADDSWATPRGPTSPGPFTVEVDALEGLRSYYVMDADGMEVAQINPIPLEFGGPAERNPHNAALLAASHSLLVAARSAARFFSEAATGQRPEDGQIVYRSLVAAIMKANGRDEEMFHVADGAETDVSAATDDNLPDPFDDVDDDDLEGFDDEHE